MGYRDPDRQRAAVRERVARSRARARERALALAEDVTPTVTPVSSPPTPPTLAALLHIGAMLGEGDPLRNETVAQYHERLRSTWKLIRRVLEE